jgi:hypothetical protein
MANLRRATGAGENDERLVGVRLDLTDSASIEEAAAMIGAAVGAPYGLVPCGMIGGNQSESRHAKPRKAWSVERVDAGGSAGDSHHQLGRRARHFVADTPPDVDVASVQRNPAQQA